MIELEGRTVSMSELGSLALYNYGHFTSMRVEHSAVRGLSLHLQRLTRDCATLFNSSLDTNRVRELVRRVTDDDRPMIARVTIFDPDLDLSTPGISANPRILVSTRPATATGLPPLRVATTRYTRDVPGTKHVGLFETIRARRIAQQRGYDDVLFLNHRDQVGEGATWNIGFFDGQGFVWPEADVLPGVTLLLVQQITERAGMASVTRPVDLESVRRMTSAFITNAAVGIRPVSSIGDLMLTDNTPEIDELRQAYAAFPSEAL